MSIAKVKLDESTKLEFGVQITGAEGKPQARFVVEGKDFSVSYPCRPMSGGGIDVELGNFKNILPAGEYPVRLEIIIENKIFIPFEDTIVLEPSVEITSKPKAVVEVKESVKVENVNVSVSKPSQKQMKIAKLIAEALKNDSYDRMAKPADIINESLANKPRLTKEQSSLVASMLKAAKDADIDFDSNLV